MSRSPSLGDESRFWLLANEMKSELEIKDRTWKLKTYKQCFVSSEAVKWLVKTGFAVDEEAAVGMGQVMLEEGYIAHVSSGHDFINAYLFYRFLPNLDAPSTHEEVAAPIDQSWDCEALAAEMRQVIAVRDRTWRLMTFKSCWLGTDAVKWLISSGNAKDEKQAVEMGQAMLNRGLLYHVARNHGFRNIPLFYRFAVDEPPSAAAPNSTQKERIRQSIKASFSVMSVGSSNHSMISQISALSSSRSTRSTASKLFGNNQKCCDASSSPERRGSKRFKQQELGEGSENQPPKKAAVVTVADLMAAAEAEKAEKGEEGERPDVADEPEPIVDTAEEVWV
ncbi:unnamed protein product [Chrysoparadoxa australica]